MKAVYLTAPGQFSTRDVADPELEGSHDVRLRVGAVGVCGSDLHYYRTGRIGSQVLTEPWIMGHECTATVESVGASVQGLAPGDRVAVDPLIQCGQCDQCLAGRINTCRRQRFLGCPNQQHGCMCELLVMPAACCFRVPAHLSPGAAVMVEPFAIALHAQRLWGNPQGKAVAVLGAGPVGLCVLGALRLGGASAVAVTDRLGYRLDMARSLGASSTHHTERSDVVREIERAHPNGVAAVFDCSGEQAALDQSIALLAPGGTLVVVGIPETDRVSFDINALRRKEIDVINVRRQNECTQDAVDILGRGALDLDPVITHHFGVNESRAAYDLVANYRDDVEKALIHFD
ncbi:MAG TPA: alcohol dehydrogenase catalytic domain-containing protein [Polyangiaceae bacterium]|nr:alcohol dehydrogenase catalytic domain-containing protein [Polyangiaceae bacterium]